MKPHGVAIHTFPPRYRLIEGHTFVPFGGLIKARWYYYLWALLGVRNQYQKGLSAKETADRNVKYAHTGTNYPPLGKLRAIGGRHFEVSQFAPHLWQIAWNAGGLRLTRPALIAYTLFTAVVWILERPKREFKS